MITPEKELTVKTMREKFEKAKSAILTDYRGLNVSKVTKLRKKLREANVEYKVIKNTLAQIAAKQAGLEELNKYLEGPVAIAFSYEDPVAPAKILADFAKENKDVFKIKAGLLEGKVVGIDGIKALADLPPREVLIAQLLAGMQSPLVGLMNVLQGPARNLVYVLEAVRKQKEA